MESTIRSPGLWGPSSSRLEQEHHNCQGRVARHRVLETPDILILSIDYGENLDADPNEGWRANLTISNTGSADAIVYFVCDALRLALDSQ